MTLPTIHVLLVEDEDAKISEWSDAVTYHNLDSERHGFTIETTSAKSVTEAKRAFELHRFDASVVDLRLQVESGVMENNTSGNDFVEFLINNHPVGIIVYTGQRAEAKEYHCPQVKTHDKGDGLDGVFQWLIDNKDIFLELRKAKATFNRETARMFFRSIWPRWRNWKTSGGLDADGLSQVLVRHVVAHVHDSLLSIGNDATHPEESYFVPPLKSRLDTGDLLEHEDAIWVVVTPRCDLANTGKVSTVLIAKCLDIGEEWNPLVSTTPKTNKTIELMNRLIQHKSSPKQHFLFPLSDSESKSRGPWFVQFHHLQAIAAQEAIEKLTPLRFASLSPLFIPSLVERFGAYYSRIGTPGFSSD